MQFFELSNEAEQLMLRACAISTSFRHDYVEMEHFLLALVTEVDNPAGRILNAHGINSDNVRPIVSEMHERYPEGQPRFIEVLTWESTRLLNASVNVAQGHRAGSLATPSHILVVLIKSEHPTVLQVFDQLDVNPDRIAVEATRYILSGVS